MAYLRNATVNLLNLHYGLHALVLNGAGAFFAVFLLKADVPLPAVFGAVALIVGLRFALRPLIVVFAPRTGLRPLVIFGTIFNAAWYLVLAEVHGVGVMLLVLCIVGAIGDGIYWTSYHAYFASLGDAEHRGHQIGAREALASLSAIIGPLFGGLALTLWGPRVAFGAAAAVQVLSALPFLYTPEVKVAPSAPGVFRAAIPGILVFAADGWIAAGFVFAWQIALFLSLGESFSAFGAALALAGLVGAAAGLALGRHIDGGGGSRAVLLTFIGMAMVTVLRAASTDNATMAVIVNALGFLVTFLYVPTLMTAVYNQAKHSPCTLRFHAATEGGWDIGCCFGCIIIAGLSTYGVPLSVAILLSLLGSLLSFVLLRRYYADAPIVMDPGIVEPTPAPELG